MKLFILNLFLFLNHSYVNKDLKTDAKIPIANVISDSKDALSAKDCIMPPDIAEASDILNRMYPPTLSPFPIPFPQPINPPPVTDVNP